MSRFLHKYRIPLLWLFILATTLAIMLPGLNGEFFFDDAPNIVANKAIHITTLDFTALKESLSGPQAGPLGRPVSVLSFALTHYFFGLDAFAFKSINLGIHAINGLFVAWLILLLLRGMPKSELSSEAMTKLSVWVAAIWLVHPINVVPVLLIVQRMTLLSGMFLLLALICHLKALASTGNKRTYWLYLLSAWLIFWPLSVLSKETGLLFPLYIIAVTVLLRPRKETHPPQISWTIPISITTLLLIAAAMISYLGWNWLDNAYAIRPFSLSERLMTESRVLWFYLSQTLLPNLASFGLYLDDFSVSTGLLAPKTTLFSIVMWLAVLFGVILFRKKIPFLSFAVAWFLIGHSLESTFLPLEIAHEYRNYIPSIGLIAGLGYLVVTNLQRFHFNGRTFLIQLVPYLPVLTLAFFTWTRTDILSNPILGPQVEAARHPNSARANHAAALALFRAGYGDQNDQLNGLRIQEYLERSNTADSTFKLGYLSLIVWACASDRPVDPAWQYSFEKRLKSTPFNPQDQELPHHILNFLLDNPTCIKRQDALRLFDAGASNSRISNRSKAKFLSAGADYELAVSNDPRSAQRYLREAVSYSPSDAGLREKLKLFSTLSPQP